MFQGNSVTMLVQLANFSLILIAINNCDGIKTRTYGCKKLGSTVVEIYNITIPARDRNQTVFKRNLCAQKTIDNAPLLTITTTKVVADTLRGSYVNFLACANLTHFNYVRGFSRSANVTDVIANCSKINEVSAQDSGSIACSSFDQALCNSMVTSESILIMGDFNPDAPAFSYKVSRLHAWVQFIKNQTQTNIPGPIKLIKVVGGNEAIPKSSGGNSYALPLCIVFGIVGSAVVIGLSYFGARKLRNRRARPLQREIEDSELALELIESTGPIIRQSTLLASETV